VDPRPNRDLVRALDRVGELAYRVFKPSSTKDLPGETVGSYRVSTFDAEADHGDDPSHSGGAEAATSRARARRAGRDPVPADRDAPRVEHPPVAVSLLAARFTWDATARRHDAVYRALAI